MTVSPFQENHTCSDSTRVCDKPVLNPVKTEDRAIAVRNLSMVFQTGHHHYPVLKDINLDIRTGDVHLLMGPSGSGKTTLLSIIAGILTPTTGQVTLLGTDITRLSRTRLATFRLKNIGFVFQGFNLFPALTAAENIEVVLTMKGYRKADAQKEVSRLLEQVELGHKENSYPRDLSGGQKQRVAIARSLAGNPPLIMADEPTAALDSSSGYAVISLLRSLAKEEGATVLMVTHDHRIKDIADHITYLEDGLVKS